MTISNANRFVIQSVASIFCLLMLTGSSFADSDKLNIQNNTSFSLQSEKEAVASNFIKLTMNRTSYSFIRKDKNILQNDSLGMSRFYQKLLALRQGKIEHVNIVQIGDSHLQSGFTPDEVRSGLQDFFGDSGRGLVFPYRTVGANEPNDVLLTTQGWAKGNSSTKTYTVRKGDTKSGIARRFGKSTKSLNRLNPGLASKKTIKPGQVLIISNSTQKIPPGLCGYSLRTSSNLNSITVITKTIANASQQFNMLSLLMDSTDRKISIEVSDKNNKLLVKSVIDPLSNAMNSVPLAWSDSVNSVQIKVNSLNGANPGVTLYGITLERNAPGIMYHSIGISGAGFVRYNQNLRFFKQLTVLKPDLVIVSLGTNDAMGTFRLTSCEQDALEFLSNIQEVLPNADILLTTPPNTYKVSRKGKVEVYAIPQICDMMKDVSNFNGFAWWNFYEIMGGQGSMKKWVSNGLAQYDHKHFSANGYREQGYLLRDSILQGYASYVARLAK